MSKFSFVQLTKNSDGKQSGSGFIGVIMGLVTTVSFVAVLVAWWLGINGALEVFEKVIQLGFLSAALMGVRKLSGAMIPKKSDPIKEENQKEKEPEKSDGPTIETI